MTTTQILFGLGCVAIIFCYLWLMKIGESKIYKESRDYYRQENKEWRKRYFELLDRLIEDSEEETENE